jgi:hypothetical protein
MTALPIVSRELRILARRPSTYWIRFGIALIALVIGAYTLAFTTSFNFGAMAKQFIYSTVSSFVGIYALFTGIRNTADNISAEKREGTLGLLFLTDLKGYDVVLGKLCSAAIHSLYGMMAAFPIFGIALIGGGITGAEFLRGSLAMINVVFFAHAAGLAVSAYSLNSRRALGTGIFIGFAMMWGLPIVTAILAADGWPLTGMWLAKLSPLNALHLALTSAPVSISSAIMGGAVGGFGRISFWSAFAVSHLFGWMFLAVACWHVPRCWQKVETRIGVRTRLQRMWLGSVEARTQFRRKLVAINPFFWLASRTRFAPHISLLTLVAVAGFITWFFWLIQGDLMGLAITLMVILHLVLRIGIASSASRHFAEQRKSGALEFLLACTPLDTKDLIRGQWLALRRQFLVPLLVVLTVDFGLAAALCIRSIHSHNEDLINYLLFGTAMVLMLIADSIALGWVGMWTGISANKPNRASGAALGRVMLWPAIVAFFIGLQTGMFGDNGRYVFLGTWFVIGMICDALLVAHARNSLHEKFRALAATPYEEQTGILGALGRAFGNAARTRPADAGDVPPVIGQ